MSWAMINGEILEEQKAFVSVADLSVTRGYGIFDYFRTSRGVALFRKEHLQRLFTSADHLKLKIPNSLEDLEMQSQRLIQKNGYLVSGIRIVVTGGISEDSYSIGRPSVIITEKVLSIAETMSRGYHLITHTFRRELPEVKSINYLTGIFLLEKIRGLGADDVLYVYENRILELPRANIFIVTKDNSLVTPDQGMLHGITRNKVLKLAEKEMAVECRAITLNELMNASEVFITSTTKRIIPVLSVNGKMIGSGRNFPVAQTLFQQLLQLEAAYIHDGAGTN